VVGHTLDLVIKKRVFEKVLKIECW